MALKLKPLLSKKTKVLDKAEEIKDKGEAILNTELNDKTVKGLKNTYSLKGMLVGVLVCFVLLLLWNGALTLKPKTQIGYVIEVNPLTGEQKKIENAVKEMSEFTTSEYLMLNTIKTYITSLRTVANDDGVNRENMKRVYAFSTGNATNFIHNFYEENNPLIISNEKNEKVDVVIYNCMPINSASGLKFQVDWNEIRRSTNGNFKSEQNYRADIDCKQYKATKQTSEVNPLGFYITNIYISEIKNGFIINSNQK